MDDKKKKKKKKGGESKVPLPSASQTEQTILEKQNLVKPTIPQVVSIDEKIIVADDIQIDVESESDNEIIKEEENLNFDDEFEKIVPSKIDDLDEISITQEDKEIVEILSGGEKLEIDDATSSNKNIIEATEEAVKEEEIEEKIENDTLETEKIDSKEEEESAEKLTEALASEEEKLVEDEKSCVKVEQIEEKFEVEKNENLSEEKLNEIKEQIESVIKEAEESTDKIIQQKIFKTTNETIIDEELLPRETILKIVAESSAEKPAIPLQTYLWEDVKRAKEQGGYPWTHLYKQPLGADEEPEVILTYKRSPKSGRRAESLDASPRSQKKVRIQDVGVQESEIEGQKEQPITESEKEESVGSHQESTEEVKKSPKGILKRSQKILGTIKPTTSFDSDSLKRKIKNPLTRIKNMADEQLKKVKSGGTKKPKKIPVRKEKILLNEEVKILKLKESPKSQHREVAAYVVKQDSDETLDIVELDQSPSETRKIRRELESGIVTPDEIIDLPVSTSDKNETTDSCKNDEMSPKSKKKEHHYEDIEDYIAEIAFDSEHVDRVHDKDEAKVEGHSHIIDPIFDEFSREFNKQIRNSLSTQDDSIKRELIKRNPKIQEQLSKEKSPENPQKAKDVKREETPSKSSKIDDKKMEEKIEEIAFDTMNRVHDNDDTQDDHKNIIDPMFDEFSREFNQEIRKSLTGGHEESTSIRQELFKRNPKLKELDKQLSKEKSPEVEKPQKVKEIKREETPSRSTKIDDKQMEEKIAEIAFDTMNRVHDQDDTQEDHKTIIDPIFDEFSREFNQEIRKSLTGGHEEAISIRQELFKRNPKLKELDKQLSKEKSPAVEKPSKNREQTPSKSKNIEELVEEIAFDSEHVDRNRSKDEAKVEGHSHIIDPIFDEFSRDFNKQIRNSLSAQDDSIKRELMKKVPKIEELDKQLSDEDREEKIEILEATNSPHHLLAPISSIDSTSSDEDRARLSMVAEESENTDSKKKSFEHEPSLDILDIESLKVDESDVETLIEEIDSKKSQDESQKKDEQNVKEDVEIKENLEAPEKIKISAKWSKMSKRKAKFRLPTGSNQKLRKGQFKKLINRCFPIF